MVTNRNRNKKLTLFANLLFLVVILTFLSGCSTKSKKAPREAHFFPVTYSKLDGWGNDHHLEAFEAFVKSCDAIEKKPSSKPISKLTQVGGRASDWQKICKNARTVAISSDHEAKLFFEKWFRPYMIRDIENRDYGTITGYYEIELRGSKKPTRANKFPVYAPPGNIDDLKGKEHFTHAAINDGALKGKNLEIAWVDSKARLFFMHTQGSGVIRLTDGGEMKVGMAGQNGFGYTHIGPMIQEHARSYSSDPRAIRSALDMMEWLDKNPKYAKKIMEQNESYIFFREIKGDGPIGAQGVPLTPERSLAIDSGLYPYGMPIWLETSLPETERYAALKKYNRLFVAQDRGGAILGAIRGDIFFGRGRRAEEVAGFMNKPGKYFVLLPKSVTVPARYRAK